MKFKEIKGAFRILEGVRFGHKSPTIEHVCFDYDGFYYLSFASWCMGGIGRVGIPPSPQHRCLFDVRFFCAD